MSAENEIVNTLVASYASTFGRATKFDSDPKQLVAQRFSMLERLQTLKIRDFSRRVEIYGMRSTNAKTYNFAHKNQSRLFVGSVIKNLSSSDIANTVTKFNPWCDYVRVIVICEIPNLNSDDIIPVQGHDGTTETIGSELLTLTTKSRISESVRLPMLLHGFLGRHFKKYANMKFLKIGPVGCMRRILSETLERELGSEFSNNITNVDSETGESDCRLFTINEESPQIATLCCKPL